MTKDLLAEVSNSLRSYGVHVGVYSAVTTSSVYLEFDHGLLRKARIGDHKGKGYNYLYEIGPHIKEFHLLNKEFMGHPYVTMKFPNSGVGQMVAEVLKRRNRLIFEVGQSRYNLMRGSRLATLQCMDCPL